MPERGKPVIKIGRSIGCSRILGVLSSSVRSLSRLERRRPISQRVPRRPKRLSSASSAQARRSGSWVLKCPDHVFALGEIQAVYPDARFVFVHRDPLPVIASVARLTEVLRQPFTKHVDRAALGRQEIERWSLGAELMIRAADDQPFAEPICHIHYRDLTRDPVGTMEKLYNHFNLTMKPEVVSHIAQLVRTNPNGGYGINKHSLDIYQIDPAVARERFAGYTERFQVLVEDKLASSGRRAVSVPYSKPLTPEPAD